MGSTTPITSLADWLSVNAGLKHLPDHVTSVIIATAACFIFQHVLSPAISSSLFPQTYPSLSKKTRRDWDVRFTAFMHAAYATAAALYVLNNPAIAPVLKADKVFAYQPQAGDLFAYSTGYFLYDLITCSIDLKTHGPGFFIHALACFSVFLAAFRPFLNYFGAIFLLWETSSIFLGIHWALDKMQLTGSIYQLVNGVFLLTTFGGIRLVWGAFNSYDFWQQVSRDDVKAVLPFGVSELYVVALAALQTLNVYWFTQMIKAIRKRFEPKKQEKVHAKKSK